MAKLLKPPPAAQMPFLLRPGFADRELNEDAVLMLIRQYPTPMSGEDVANHWPFNPREDVDALLSSLYRARKLKGAWRQTPGGGSLRVYAFRY